MPTFNQSDVEANIRQLVGSKIPQKDDTKSLANARTRMAAATRQFIKRDELLPVGLPIAILMASCAVFFLWPILSLAVRSFDPEGKLDYNFSNFTLESYFRLFDDPVLQRVVINTLTTSTISTLITLVLAFPVSYFLSRLSARASSALLLLILLPFWVSILVRLFVFVELLASNGPVNAAFEAIGLGKQDLLFNTTGTIIGMVSYLLPYLILILFSSMRGIDLTLIEAARSMGASNLKIFTRVYFPLVKNSIIGGLLLVLVIATGFFLTPAVLGGPGDMTIATYISAEVSNFHWSSASALGVLLLIATAMLFAFAGRLSGLFSVGNIAGTSGKGSGRFIPMPRGPLKILLSAVTGAVFIFQLVPLLMVFPLSVTASSTVSWPPRGFTLWWYGKALSDPLWQGAITKSLLVAISVALICAGFSVFLARAVAALENHPVWQGVLSTLIYLPIVTPVILLAIGTMDVQGTLGLLGSNFGLIMVQSVMALPYTYLVVSSALAALDNNLEKAAWTMGLGNLRTLYRVVLPSIVPALFGAGVLAFVSAWDEAVVALFQTGFEKTLPVIFFSLMKSGANPTVAAIGALLVLAVITAVLIPRIRFRRPSSKKGEKR